jgi:hypothetical protein
MTWVLWTATFLSGISIGISGTSVAMRKWLK